MQVRKYEASSIKEAVDMIKRDLGPDAIILSTKESQRVPAGTRGSVVITAAVTEETYHRKQVVQQQLNKQELDRLHAKPARVQKQFIEKSYTSLRENIEAKRRNMEARNYASIPDEDFYDDEIPQAPIQKLQTKAKQATSYAANAAQKRVRDAVQAAFKVSDEKELMISKPVKVNAVAPVKMETTRIDELKNEIKRLQGMVQNMNVAPKPIAQGHAAAYPGARYGVAYETSSMFEKLVAEGFDERGVAELLKNAQLQLKENIRKKGLLEAWVAKWIHNCTSIVKERLQARYHVFVGPRGVGKTSTLVKMASHLVIKERKRVGIISADTNKVGAAEQLRIYSQILNVPFAIWRKGEDINMYLREMEMCDYILIDTEGQSLLKMEEIETLRSFIPQGLGNLKVHLVVSAMLKDEELYSCARRFKSVNYHDVVLTNLDQLRKHAVLVNFQQQMQVPYFAFAAGPMIPEDFEWASKERVLDLIFKLSKTNQREGI